MNRCKICKSDTLMITDIKTSRNYHKCLTCEYIFLDKSFHLEEEMQKQHYDNHDNNLESLGYVKMFEELIEEFVTPYASTIETALDFGCGEGEVLSIILRKIGIKSDSYDLFYFPKKVYEGKKYDLIASTEVFEHLSDVDAVMKILLEYLNDNAYLLLMTSFHPNDDDKFFRWYYIKDMTHVGFFTLETFEYIATKYNLKIVKTNHKNTILLQKNIKH
ncbi:MAG: class I SAM-dependent methyltransferase [Campylobacterota bacterium]|nr:class I SAM-dependent methyltransferase [Campylobacterota bacterium]